jgi:hypothetical protein
MSRYGPTGCNSLTLEMVALTREMVYFGFYSFRELLKLAQIFMSILDHGNLWFQRTSSAQGMYGTVRVQPLRGCYGVRCWYKMYGRAGRLPSARGQYGRSRYAVAMGSPTGTRCTEQDEAPPPFPALLPNGFFNARWAYGLQPSFPLVSSRQKFLS